MARALVACEPLDVDLEGPTVVEASILGPVELEVAADRPLWVRLSEPPGPGATARAALVGWTGEGTCALSPRCREGRCIRGRCLVDPVDDSFVRRLDRGEAQGVRHPQWSGPRLVWPRDSALRPGQRYSLVLGPGFADASGARLEGGEGPLGAYRVDFVTAGEGSGGPEPRLQFPASASRVPTNLAHVQTRFARPVRPHSGASLDLEAEDGSRVPLQHPAPCPGHVPGSCLSWSLDAPLRASTTYRLAGGTLLDLAGRHALLPADPDLLFVGPGEDLAPPHAPTGVERRGSCVAVILPDDDYRELRLEGGTRPLRWSGAGPAEVVIAAGPTTELRGDMVDLAGNRRAVALEVPPPPGDLPPLWITEILANPAGREPHDEFIEIYAGGEVSTEGLFVADRSWSEVRAALGAGEEPPGDALPAVPLSTGDLALVVARDFHLGTGAEAPVDEPAAQGAVLLRVDGSLGSGGLKNAGEPVTLYRAQPPALVASYGDWIDVSASAHGGRSVVLVDLASPCDHPSAWRSHLVGASPGAWP